MTHRHLLALLLFLPCPALAAAWGNPVADPEAARLSLGAEADMDQEVLRTEGCAGAACEAVWRPVQLGGRAELAVVRGVGLTGGASWARDRIEEAGFSGQGIGAWGGLDLAMPVQPTLFLALSSRYSAGRTEEAGDTSTWSRLAFAGFVAWAPVDHSFALYGGASFAPRERHTVHLESPLMALSLSPRLPVGGVAGLELRSNPLGLPWARTRTSLVLAAELRAESGLGGGLRLAVEL